jgi:hypothetical protein
MDTLTSNKIQLIRVSQAQVHDARLSVVEHAEGYREIPPTGLVQFEGRDVFLTDARMLLSMLGLDIEPAGHLMPTDSLSALP